MKSLNGLTFIVGYCALVYLAVFEHIAGAVNLLIFTTWVAVAGSITVAIINGLNRSKKCTIWIGVDKDKPVLLVLYSAIIGVLIWNGFWNCGIGFLMYALLSNNK